MPRVVVIAVENALASSITAPMEMLRAAEQFVRSERLSSSRLQLLVASEHGGSVHMSGGLSIADTRPITEIGSANLLIIPSLWRAPARTVTRHPALRSAFKRLFQSECLICAAGTGSYFLGIEGVLNDRPATTHWSYFDDFAERFPKVQLQRQHLITQSGRYYCAGSVNSVADLMIHFIDGFFGQRAARHVEGQFSPEIRRPFEAHSFIQGQPGAHPDETISQVQDWIAQHLADPISLTGLARLARLSTRNFSRRFKTALGTSPARYVTDLRMRTAQDLLRQTDLEIGEIAHRTGYPDASHFTRAFVREVDATPTAWRQRVRGKLFVR